MAGVTLHPMEVESGVSKFDLVVLLWDAPVGICGTFEYDPDLFDAATIEALAARFDTLVERLIAAPDSRLSAWREQFAHQNPTQRRPVKRFEPSVRRKLISPEKGT
jgi:non-ribosomal peptide synthetase component F